ncbi:MAG: TonB-dependent receptor [Pseudomonadota bacterium]
MLNRIVLKATVALAPLVFAQVAVAQTAQSQSPNQANPPAEQSAEPAPAASQDYDPTSDIVVTAQKREQSVQSVPIAITAIGSEALLERQIVDVAGLANISPSTTFTAGSPFSGSTAVLAAYIRGIGSNEFAINLDPGVGIYLDGVYLARTIGANVDLPDVERVEILKGPQGTLFGRNTIGGAVSVVTRDPGDKFAIRGEATTGRFNRLDAQASIDIPITESMSSLITFAVKNRDGFQKRVPFPSATAYVTESPSAIYAGQASGGPDTQGGENSRTVRGKLRFDDGGPFRATIAGDYLRVDQTALNNSLIAIVPTGLVGIYNFCLGATPAMITGAGLGGFCGPRGTPLNPASQLPGLGGLNLGGGTPYLPFDNRFLSADIDKNYATGANYSKIRSYSFTGTLEYDLSQSLKLKSITSYRDLNFAAGLDADGSPLPILELSYPIEQHQFSQELQISGSALEDRLNYVVGGYYFTESSKQTDIALVVSGFITNVSPYRQETKNAAVFGQIDWRITDLIGITVGGRYTNERKAFSSGGSELNGFDYKVDPSCTGPINASNPCFITHGYPDASNPLGYYPPGVFRKKFNNFSPKVGIDLHPADDVMIYGSYSQGYKTGGFVQRLSAPSSTAPSFGPEKATTYEIGLKSRIFDRRLQLNLSAFTTNYEAIQLNYQVGVTPTIQNAGTARIKGVEVEANASLGGGLSFSSSVSYTDARFTSVLPGATVAPNGYQAGVFVGSALPKTPEWKVNFSPRYELHLGNGGKLIQTVDYTFQSRTWNDTERTYLLSQPSTNTLGASLSYAAPNGQYRITVGGTNLLNERYVTNGLAQLGGGLIYGTYNRPAEWYAKFGFNF